jgi:phosphoglycolate phosphatase
VKAFNEVCGKHGLRPVSAAEHEELRGLTGLEMLRRMKIPLWRLPKLVAEMRRLMAEHIGEFSLFDGIEESLARLEEAGMILGIVSSNSAENVQRVLGPKNVARIRHFHCGASMFGKPSKIRALLKAAGVPAREAIYVGDEVRDAEAATKVGMDYGAVAWGYHPIETLRPPAAEVFLKPCEIGNRLMIR